MASRCDVRIVGIGGVGCRVLETLGREWAESPERIAVHTRAGELKRLENTPTLQLGELITGGLSTGGDPEAGRQAAEAEADRIRPLLESAHVVLIVVGLGGGTGSGAVPVIAKLAREAGALTLVFCTLPFFFEGSHRRSAAEESLAELHSSADGVIAFPNQRLFEWMGPQAGIEESFNKAAAVVASSLRALWMLLSRNGVLHLDLADLRSIARHAGGVLSLAQAEAQGENRAAQAARLIQNSPLLEHGSVISAAPAVMIGVLGGPDLTLLDLQTALSGVSELTRPGAVVHVGAVVDPESVDRIHITVLAAAQSGATRPPPEPEGIPTPADSREPEPGKPVRRARKSESGSRTVQVELPMGGVRKGRFVNVEPTIFDGQDLDVPTFIRKGIRLSRNPS